MADGFNAKMLVQPAIDEMVAMDKRMDRATMWALREVGRAVKREARRRAPVYKGAGRQTMKLREVKRRRSEGDTSSAVVVPGLLRDSISSSRRFARAGEAFVLKVGPRGPRAHLYAARIEARSPYMEPGLATVIPQISALHAKAWERAMNSKKK
jgi:hypothetical protein